MRSSRVFASSLQLLGFLAWTVVSTIVTCLLLAWELGTLWRWFVASQYGVGPTFRTWVGFVMLAELAFLAGEASRSPRDDEETTLWSLVRPSLWTWGSSLALLGMAWCLSAALDGAR